MKCSREPSFTDQVEFPHRVSDFLQNLGVGIPVCNLSTRKTKKVVIRFFYIIALQRGVGAGDGGGGEISAGN